VAVWNNVKLRCNEQGQKSQYTSHLKGKVRLGKDVFESDTARSIVYYAMRIPSTNAKMLQKRRRDISGYKATC
jgi:hypothetical protein